MWRRIFDRLVLLTFFCCCQFGVFADTDVKSVSVTEGDSVTLQINYTKIHIDDMIMWNFEINNTLIAKLSQATNTTTIINDALGGQFRDRLKLDNKTVSLTITDARIKDSGGYQLTISSKTKSKKSRFDVAVFARLPVPVIFNEFQQNSSTPGAYNCSLVCSVEKVSHVTLSWLKGTSLLSSISVSDLNKSLSLHLECLDDSYSCVVNNPIGNQTRPLISELCRPCSDCTFCCTDSEVVTRLAISTLVGVAAVVIVAYDVFTS